MLKAGRKCDREREKTARCLTETENKEYKWFTQDCLHEAYEHKAMIKQCAGKGKIVRKTRREIVDF